jgi:hypothetical protein
MEKIIKLTKIIKNVDIIKFDSNNQSNNGIQNNKN